MLILGQCNAMLSWDASGCASGPPIWSCLLMRFDDTLRSHPDTPSWGPFEERQMLAIGRRHAPCSKAARLPSQDVNAALICIDIQQDCAAPGPAGYIPAVSLRRPIDRLKPMPVLDFQIA